MKCVQLTGLLITVLVIACSGAEDSPQPETTSVPPPQSVLLPEIKGVTFSTSELKKHSKVELIVELEAEFTNPYDSREIALNAQFEHEQGKQLELAGFWDGVSAWRIRFSPPETGQWQYSIQVKDQHGASLPISGQLDIASSDLPGIIQIANQIDSKLSSRYFAYPSGKTFYGIGHADAFSIFRLTQFENEVERLIREMKSARENYVVWWPQFYFSLVEDSFNDYRLEHVELIDAVLEKFEQEQLVLIFTVWDHSNLRGVSHPWGDSRWFQNGFNQLVSSEDFFVDEEAWAWQENLYRYIIARWSYSPAIAMWQTVSEINGTDAQQSTDRWHQMINDYFKNNDPFAHPTTASMSGDLLWPQGFDVMDVPQTHIYQSFLDNGESESSQQEVKVVESASVIAQFTRKMFDLENKPNWIGEFGVTNNISNYYPELFHYALWSSLVSGAAMTPAEWNDFGRWGVMTDDMQRHISNFSDFVSTLPLAEWNPKPIEVMLHNNQLRGWGMSGSEGAIIWIQDVSLQGLAIDQIRARRQPIQSSAFSIQGLEGLYQALVYNTWRGEYESNFLIDCSVQENCTFPIPEFFSDVAIKLEKIENR